MPPYYTYVPPPKAPEPPKPEPKPEPKPASTSYYNYHPPYAGRLTSAYPPCLVSYPAPFFTYTAPVIVHTPNVPKEYVSFSYVINLTQPHGSADLTTNSTSQTAEPAVAPVYYQSHPHYYYAAPAPVAVAAAKPPEEKKDKDHVYWYGSTKQEVDVQNYAVHKAHAKPTPLVPYKPSSEQQFWCRELDGSYTLRTTTDIMDNLQPGYWKYGEEGYPYFTRQKKG